MEVRFATSMDGVTTDHLSGFFVGWPTPPSADKHLRMLQNSQHIVLAFDGDNKRVIGFINALTDKEHFAFIPLLEVLPEYQGQGIGRELVERMLDALRDYPCVDLTCDPELQPFYKRLGLCTSTGMIIRDNSRRGPVG